MMVFTSTQIDDGRYREYQGLSLKRLGFKLNIFKVVGAKISPFLFNYGRWRKRASYSLVLLPNNIWCHL